MCIVTLKYPAVDAHSRQMQPWVKPAELRCFTTQPSYSSRSLRMPSTRDTSLVRNGGFESKGLVLLAICGLYAVFLFIVARIFSTIASSVMSSVKSLVWKVDVTEISPVPEFTECTDSNNSGLKFKVERLQPRTVSHG